MNILVWNKWIINWTLNHFITLLTECVIDSLNLIARITYSFQLEVFKYNNKLITYGKSTTIENCCKCIYDITYDTINEYRKSTQSRSVTATGDMWPLLCGYCHPNLLSTLHIDHIQPSVHVFDEQSVLATDCMQCNIILNSYVECTDKNNICHDIDSLITEYDKFLYCTNIKCIFNCSIKFSI